MTIPYVLLYITISMYRYVTDSDDEEQGDVAAIEEKQREDTPGLNEKQTEFFSRTKDYWVSMVRQENEGAAEKDIRRLAFRAVEIAMLMYSKTGRPKNLINYLIVLITIFNH